jgi:hypothetical protein
VNGAGGLESARAAFQMAFPALQKSFGEVCNEDLEYARQVVAYLEQTLAIYARAPASAPALHPISTLVFDYLTLRLLIGRGDNRTDKQDLYAGFGLLKAEVGAFGAFNTRLAKLKIAGRITWVDNKQNSPVEITDEGVDACERLGAGGSGGLKKEDLEFWAPKLAAVIESQTLGGTGA